MSDGGLRAHRRKRGNDHVASVQILYFTSYSIISYSVIS